MRTLLVVLCFAVWQVRAQVPTFTGVKAAGGARPNAGNGIAVDASGNSYVAGAFGFQTLNGTLDLGSTNLVSAGGSDGFIAKFNPQGDCLWARQIGGTGKDDAYDVTVRSDGSVLVTGEFEGTTSIGGTALVSHGGFDIFLAAFSPSGNLLWSKAVGGNLNDSAIALAPAADGAVLFTGSFAGSMDLGNGIVFSSADDDALLMKLTASGVVQWARVGAGQGFQLGSDVKVDAAGNVYWVGEFQTNITFSGSSLQTLGFNVFVAKYDSAGTRLLSRKLGNGEAADLPRIAHGPNGRVLCTASYSGPYEISGESLPAGQDDILLASFDSADAFEWVSAFGGSELEVCTELLVDASGASYLAGHFRGNMTFGNSNLVSSGSTDIFVARCGPQGELQGVAKAGGLGADLAFSAERSLAGDIRLTGSFAGTAQFGSTSVTSPDGLAKTYVATVLPPPTLRITAFPTHVLLSWPSVYNNFVLQESATLDPTSWSTVSASPASVNGELVVTNQLSAAPTFFRLTK